MPLSAPSRTLETMLSTFDYAAVDEEFNRALSNLESEPREAVSAASNILESFCKVYIADNGLEMPAKQDLKAVWSVVRKHLGFDASLVADQDLQTILTGLLAVVEGIGALRTHASSAHGAGKTGYRLEPRHARLAIHAAHTVVLFGLETWDKRRKAS
ncbi:abortive infection family protein [Paraburkholderia sp. MM5482-R1]|uniref:abortive infection family protein n=1 Tax=unclassified Paraburkholderia TaxID=2615204 RepID=UPI003D208F63